jgi:uncharacterized protein (DUF983 family)
MSDPAKGPLGQSILRGFMRQCPQCGKASLYERYLKPTKSCANCGSAFAHIRTDDFAPWLTIIALAHILVPLIIHIEAAYSPPLWISYSIVLPSLVLLILLTLPNFKGACVALMWSLGLRGDEQH